MVLWDAPTLTQLGSIEGRQDLRPGRRADDKVTAKQLKSSWCVVIFGAEVKVNKARLIHPAHVGPTHCVVYFATSPKRSIL